MQKNSPEKFYHIYLKGECVYNCLNEKKFTDIYNTMREMVELLDTQYVVDDITYEVVETLRTVEESSY
tara:strand:+ start:2386 stop:2589 length:204 start_codon:yes stop_codon:yes gene_type:complete